MIKPRQTPRPWRRLLGLLATTLIGAAFGALTASVNALALHSTDLESEEATIRGWSPADIASILLDVGWAWAALAVLTGWLAARRTPRPLLWGAAAGALALLTATEAYAIGETIQDGSSVFSWQALDPVWSIASIIFGIPLGMVGAYITRPGPLGLAAKMVVPVGATVQMVLFPPGRNPTIATIGQALVCTAAAATIAFTLLHFHKTHRHSPS